MSELAIVHPQPESIAHSVTVDSGKVLSYLGLNPSDPKSQAVVAVCQRYDLDPVLKHVIVIPGGGVYITRDGLLHVAHRSGQLDGIQVDQEPTLSEDGKEYVARVSVYRKDMSRPFTFPGRYPVQGKNRDYPQEMALKAAEAHALRRAFSVAGLPAEDEQRGEPIGGLASVLHAEQIHDEPEEQHESPLLNVKSKLAIAMYASIGDDPDITEDERVVWIANVIGRDIGSTKEMTEDEAREVLAVLDSRKAQREDAS